MLGVYRGQRRTERGAVWPPFVTACCVASLLRGRDTASCRTQIAYFRSKGISEVCATLHTCCECRLPYSRCVYPFSLLTVFFLFVRLFLTIQNSLFQKCAKSHVHTGVGKFFFFGGGGLQPCPNSSVALLSTAAHTSTNRKND
jgi:hypothetical protein